MTTFHSSYALDNDDEWADSHHALLSLLWDESTIRETLKFGSLGGKRCLEIGAGVRGRFALWLADEVGEHGFVLATDIQPRNIPVHPSLTVMVHDLTSGVPLDGTWDYIHARLVLAHIPQRRAIISHLANILAPGGVLLTEDWSPQPDNMVMRAPTMRAKDLYTRFQKALTEEVFMESGVDPSWARRAHAAMVDEGLVDVRTSIHSEAWTGGEPGTELIYGTIDQLRHRLLATGITNDELGEVKELLDDPNFVLAGHLMFSTSGRKPESGE